MIEERPLEALGQVLKRQREEQGRSLRDIADKTRIPISVLEALETGDPTDLPAPVFVKGFLRSYAIEVGLKPVDVLQEYKLFNPERTENVAVPITARSGGKGGFRFYSTVLVFFIVVAAVAGAYYYLPHEKMTAYVQNLIAGEPVQPDEPESPGIAATETNDPGTTTESPSGPVTVAVTETTTPPTESAPEERSTETAPTETGSTGETPAVTETPPPTSAPAATETVTASVGETTTPPPGGYELKMDFTEEVWVQVRIDGAEDTQHGLYGPGMSRTWKADKGFVVRLGNAGGVNLFFNGSEQGSPGSEGQVVRLVYPPEYNPAQQ